MKGLILDRSGFVKVTKNHQSLELLDKWEFKELPPGVYTLRVWNDWADKQKGKEPDRVLIKQV